MAPHCEEQGLSGLSCSEIVMTSENKFYWNDKGLINCFCWQSTNVYILKVRRGLSGSHADLKVLLYISLKGEEAIRFYQ